MSAMFQLRNEEVFSVRVFEDIRTFIQVMRYGSTVDKRKKRKKNRR